MNQQIEGYFCSCCKKYHNELPMSYGSPAPDYYDELSVEHQKSRVEINQDVCVIDNEHFFVRGCIEIPVIGSDKQFIWDVWVSLSEANFYRLIDYWDTEGREEVLEPMFGWLSTSIPCYPETIHLKTMVHTRSIGIKPYIELEPTNHPLAIEQRKGVSMERIKQIAEELCDGEQQQKNELQKDFRERPMNSFLNKTIGIFFEKTNRTVKPLMYAQLTICIGIVLTLFLTWNNDSLSSMAIIHFLLGTYFLLSSIEQFIIKPKQRKGSILWFICALLFYWIAFDYFIN